MNHRGLRAATLAAAALVLAIASAGCATSEQPTPIYVIVTPTPAAATPTGEATPLATFTPWPTGTPTPVPTPTPTAGPTDTPSAGPTSLAGSCTGSASNQTFFLQAAKGVKSTVYCATGLPSGWTISSGNWAGNKSGGWVDVIYKYKKTSEQFELKEGAFCLTDALTCNGGPHPYLGATNFDGLSASLDSTGGAGLLVTYAPGTSHAYQIWASNVPQATLVTIAANMKAVPKS